METSRALCKPAILQSYQSLWSAVLVLLLGFALPSLALEQKTGSDGQGNAGTTDSTAKDVADKVKQTGKEGTFKDSNDGTERKKFNRGDCDPDKTVDIKLPSSVTGVEVFTVKTKSESSDSEGGDKKKAEKLTCPDKPGSTIFAKKISSLNGFAVSNLFKGETACQEGGEGEKAGEAVLCLYDGDKLVGLARYSYSTIKPPTPALGILEGENKVILFPQGEGTSAITRLFVCHAPVEKGLLSDDVFDADAGCPTGATGLEVGLTNGQAVVGGLTNGVTVQFRVRGIDEFGNWSAWSGMARGTAVELRGPLSDYDGEPNPLSWSCGCGGDANAPATSGAGEFFAWLALMTLVARWQRKRKARPQIHGSVVAAMFVWVGLSVLTAPPAGAEPGSLSIGINGGPYRPAMDNQVKADGALVKSVYRDFFARSDDAGPWLPLMGLEANVNLYDAFGSIQLGSAVAYTMASGYAYTKSGESSGIRVGLHLLQIRPQLLYVFDPYVHVVPLVPYARGGFVAMGYGFLFDGKPDYHGLERGHNPVGVVLGADAAFGLLLAMDWMEPGVAARARGSGVYRHVYLKLIELAYSPIDNFGLGGPLLSPTDLFGSTLPLQLTFGLVMQF
ncbi:MAG: hypothetical protein AAF471_02820 [Myxococcota bacterium]